VPLVFDFSGSVETAAGIVLVQRTPKDLSALGETEVIAAQAGKKIRILALYIRSAAAVVVFFKTGPGGIKISSDFSMGVNDDTVLPNNIHGWMETNAGQAFVANQSLAVASGLQAVWIAL